jgi:hypothetical protein
MRSLDRCLTCGEGFMEGKNGTKKTSNPAWKVRYLRCDVCGATGKQRIPAGIPRRKRELVPLLGTQRGKRPGFDVVKTADAVTLKAERHHAAADVRKDGRTMLFSIFEVTKNVGLGSDWQTTRDWIEFGVIPPPIIVGGFLRFRQSDLDAWLAAGCPQSAIVPEADCEPFWDALLAELKYLDQNERN